MTGGRGGHDPQVFPNHRIFGNFNALLENFWTFTVGKNKGFSSYQKIIELPPPPTLQVP